jgi:hypothetical protein
VRLAAFRRHWTIAATDKRMSRRVAALVGARRSIVAGLLAVSLPACASPLTPAQARTYEAYDACRAAGYLDGSLVRVWPDGRALIAGGEMLQRPLVACMNDYVRSGQVPAR